ncbi:MAG: J domain-containing protein [Syntrophobacterales bacterium]|nr:J domain-containing protein [Syntrophobacterales bacterium]
MSSATAIIPHERQRSKYRCLSCGTTENMGRRRYCSVDCRQKLRLRLDARTGLVEALNTRCATFSFSETLIMMDILPYGSSEIFSFLFPRTPGKKPSEDFSSMADILGERWWAEKRRTNKRFLASQHVLEQAVRNYKPLTSVKPVITTFSSVKKTSLLILNLGHADLCSPRLQELIKTSFRQQAKVHHPDAGGDAEVFRKLYQAYEEMISWANNPTFIRRRGFPDKWFYDGDKKKWVQPLPG